MKAVFPESLKDGRHDSLKEGKNESRKDGRKAGLLA
jgi:hypothetical protein